MVLGERGRVYVGGGTEKANGRGCAAGVRFYEYAGDTLDPDAVQWSPLQTSCAPKEPCDERVAAIALDVVPPRARVLLVGTTSGALSSGRNKGLHDVFVAFWNPSDGSFGGGSQWGTRHQEEAVALGVDAKGNVYILGELQSESGELPGRQDAFVAMWNAKLELQWVRVLGGTGETRAGGLAVAPDGELLVGLTVTGQFARWDSRDGRIFLLRW